MVFLREMSFFLIGKVWKAMQCLKDLLLMNIMARRETFLHYYVALEGFIFSG